jgi:hypothetical protein
MKNFIKAKLKLLLEAASDYATKKDYYTTIFKMAKAKQLYGGDPYWENKEDGQFIASAVVNIHGYIKISTFKHQAGDIRRNDIGDMSENPHYLTFRISAGRGIEHPDTYTPNLQPARSRGGIEGSEDDETFTFKLPDGVSLENGETTLRIGLPRPGSPASDAVIKAYLIYGPEIKDFVEKNMKDQIGYKDGQGANIANKQENDDKLFMIRKMLSAKLKKKGLQPSEWQAFQNAMEQYGINLDNIDLHQISNEDDFDKIIQMAGLSQRQAPQDDEDAYLEKIKQMQALKDRVGRRK